MSSVSLEFTLTYNDDSRMHFVNDTAPQTVKHSGAQLKMVFNQGQFMSSLKSKDSITI